MRADRAAYQALLESIADGAAIDWTSVEENATTDAQRRQYRNLRLVARVVELHRSIGDAGIEAAEAEPAPAPFQKPTRWGHIDVGDRLAGGAFGTVYRAHDSNLDREVALKILR